MSKNIKRATSKGEGKKISLAHYKNNRKHQHNSRVISLSTADKQFRGVFSEREARKVYNICDHLGKLF